jgi:hypothetical protein
MDYLIGALALLGVLFLLFVIVFTLSATAEFHRRQRLQASQPMQALAQELATMRAERETGRTHLRWWEDEIRAGRIQLGVHGIVLLVDFRRAVGLPTHSTAVTPSQEAGRPGSEAPV